jgi:serine/threonine protein kinase
MATVYAARDLKHDRLVALKVLLPELAATLGPERFRREIAVAAKLQHPHILSVYDSGESAAGQLWFTMPYVDGESTPAERSPISTRCWRCPATSPWASFGSMRCGRLSAAIRGSSG